MISKRVMLVGALQHAARLGACFEQQSEVGTPHPTVRADPPRTARSRHHRPRPCTSPNTHCPLGTPHPTVRAPIRRGPPARGSRRPTQRVAVEAKLAKSLRLAAQAPGAPPSDTISQRSSSGSGKDFARRSALSSIGSTARGLQRKDVERCARFGGEFGSRCSQRSAAAAPLLQALQAEVEVRRRPATAAPRAPKGQLSPAAHPPQGEEHNRRASPPTRAVVPLLLPAAALQQ